MDLRKQRNTDAEETQFVSASEIAAKRSTDQLDTQQLDAVQTEYRDRNPYRREKQELHGTPMTPEQEAASYREQPYNSSYGNASQQSYNNGYGNALQQPYNNGYGNAPQQKHRQMHRNFRNTGRTATVCWRLFGTAVLCKWMQKWEEWSSLHGIKHTVTAAAWLHTVSRTSTMNWKQIFPRL